MKTNTKQVLSILKVISWVLFIGICIKTGALLTSFFISLYVNAEAAKDLYLGFNLSDLYKFDIWQYASLVSFTILLWMFRAFIFFLIIKIFTKINLVNPFSAAVYSLLSKISYIALGIGAGTLLINRYCEWLSKKGVVFPDMQTFLGGGAEYIFLGAILFMIAMIFKRGIEIQSENELTV